MRLRELNLVLAGVSIGMMLGAITTIVTILVTLKLRGVL